MFGVPMRLVLLAAEMRRAPYMVSEGVVGPAGAPAPRGRPLFGHHLVTRARADHGQGRTASDGP
jgi:hypothetical protein